MLFFSFEGALFFLLSLMALQCLRSPANRSPLGLFPHHWMACYSTRMQFKVALYCLWEKWVKRALHWQPGSFQSENLFLFFFTLCFEIPLWTKIFLHSIIILRDLRSRTELVIWDFLPLHFEISSNLNEKTCTVRISLPSHSQKSKTSFRSV